MKLAYTYAVSMGFPIPEDNVIFGCSHTHSGPGGKYSFDNLLLQMGYSLFTAVSSSFLWQIAPAVGM